MRHVRNCQPGWDEHEARPFHRLSCGNLTDALPFVPPTQDEIQKVAALAYTEAVTPADRERNEVDQRYKNRTNLKEWKTYCWKLAYAERDFLVALRGITDPDDGR
ncbi:MAG TPA: hypothetical protein VFJ71_09260 [Candidatus Limnocylindrales bacterium]|nr:hypothetical protein [Candidatus Limnocylindrales bacterium]